MERQISKSPSGAAMRTAEYRARVTARNRQLEKELLGLAAKGLPIVCEMGCGHGHFLTAYAAAHPQQICVGLDIVRDRIQRASRKCRRAGLANLHFVLAEAHEFLGALPAAVTFSEVYVLFPDPWPKRRHHKNRLLQPAFLDALFRRVGENSRLYFRTDHEPYFRAAVFLIQSDPNWEIREEPFSFETETVFQARAPRFFSLVAYPKQPLSPPSAAT